MFVSLRISAGLRNNNFQEKQSQIPQSGTGARLVHPQTHTQVSRRYMSELAFVGATPPVGLAFAVVSSRIKTRSSFLARRNNSRTRWSGQLRLFLVGFGLFPIWRCSSSLSVSGYIILSQRSLLLLGSAAIALEYNIH